MGKSLDLAGQKFSKLTVESFVGNIGGKSIWKCKCDCGNECTARGTDLKRGRKRSCGCLQDESRRKRKGISINVKDLTGMKFNMLTVIERDGNDNFSRAKWKCRCDCGNYISVAGYLLTSGHTKSCGCLKIEKAIDNLPQTPKGKEAPFFKHGLTDTRLHRIWKGMKARCYNVNVENYKNYGGRGIRVCEEWKDDFMAFYNWAIENGYRDDLSIDRIDNNGNYEPSNCRWATMKMQAQNRRHFKIPGNYIPVICLDTGKVYESVGKAAEETGAPGTSISACLHGKLKRAGGCRWTKYEGEKNDERKNSKED